MSSTPTDAELVRAARAGDVASLGALLERHRAGMRVVALSLLGYGPDAQDAVQDAMLIALQRLHELRDPTAAGAWLRAIVRNACRARLRSARHCLTDDSAILAYPSNDLSPDALLDQHELRDWVWHALEELSEPLQLVVLLRYFSGITRYSQIAALCDVPIGTVRSRLNQARLKMSALLLASADAAYHDTLALTTARRQEVAELFAEAERGAFERAFGARWSANLVVLGPQGQYGRSLDFLVQIMRSDYDAGVRQRLVDVTASSRFTIMECDLLSPPWDPEHCPPGVVWLLSLRDRRVERARLFHPQPAVNETV